MDRTDLKILAILQEDSSLPVAEVASRVNLSQTPCWRRIQKLEAQGVIARRVAILDPDSVGLGISVFVSKPVPLTVLRQAVQGLVHASKGSPARAADSPRP